MKGSKENGKSQKHSQASEEGCVPSSQDSHPSSSPRRIWSCSPCARGDHPRCTRISRLYICECPHCLMFGLPSIKVGVKG